MKRAAPKGAALLFYFGGTRFVASEEKQGIFPFIHGHDGAWPSNSIAPDE